MYNRQKLEVTPLILKPVGGFESIMLVAEVLGKAISFNGVLDTAITAVVMQITPCFPVQCKHCCANISRFV